MDNTIRINYASTNFLILVTLVDQLEVFIFGQFNAVRKLIGQGFGVG